MVGTASRVTPACVADNNNDDDDDHVDEASIRSSSSSASLDSEDPKKKPSDLFGFSGAFRLAQIMGIFPVDDSVKQRNTMSLNPVSVRLLVTVLLLLLVAAVEAVGLINIFFAGKDSQGFQVSMEGYVIATKSLASDLAPLVHYGTTLSGMLFLLNVARRFGSTSSSWRRAESALAAAGSSAVEMSSCAASRCATVAIVTGIVLMAITQATLGLLCSVAIDFNNDTATFVAVEDFFTKYAMGTHSFFSAVVDESFLVGVFTFLVCNYTVLVWAVLDVATCLATRSLARSVDVLGAAMDQVLEEKGLDERRFCSRVGLLCRCHRLLCDTVRSLSSSGLDWLLFSQLFGAVFFLWNHLSALVVRPVQSYVFVGYHVWAALRQCIRIWIATGFTVGISEGLCESPLRFVWKASEMTDDVCQQVQRLQAQASLTFNGFSAGQAMSITRRSVSAAAVIFFVLFVINAKVEQSAVDQLTTVIRNDLNIFQW